MGQEELAKYEHHHHQQPLLHTSTDSKQADEDDGLLQQQKIMQAPVLDTGCPVSSFCCSSNDDGLNTVQLLVQAHVLLRKNVLYQRIDRSLRKQMFFQSAVFEVMSACHDDKGAAGRPLKDKVTPALRDIAINNIRFLCIFYSCPPEIFAVAINLLDRLLGKVKVHSKYLSTIATCCFYISVRLQQADPESNSGSDCRAPCIKREELLKLSQCGEHTTMSDLIFTECQILDLVPCEPGAGITTPLSFLQLFYEMCALSNLSMLNNTDLSAAAVAKLEVVLCSFEFTRFRADVIALALLDCILPDLTSSTSHLSTILELQYYCQMYDGTYEECVALIKRYLHQYENQPSKVPRLKLSWSISRRILHKMKPSTRVQLDLEPIIEDEDFCIDHFNEFYIGQLGTGGLSDDAKLNIGRDPSEEVDEGVEDLEKDVEECERADEESSGVKMEQDLMMEKDDGVEEETVDSLSTEDEPPASDSGISSFSSDDDDDDDSSRSFDSGFFCIRYEEAGNHSLSSSVGSNNIGGESLVACDDGAVAIDNCEDTEDAELVDADNDDEVFTFDLGFEASLLLGSNKAAAADNIVVGGKKKACAVTVTTCAQCYQSECRYLVAAGHPSPGDFDYGASQLVGCRCDDNNNQVAA